MNLCLMALLATLATISGCSGAAPNAEQQSTPPPSASPSTVQPAVPSSPAVSNSGTPAISQSNRPSAPSTPTAAESARVTGVDRPRLPTMQTTEKNALTVEQLLASVENVGRVISVRGRCSGYQGSDEPPPVSRSDWLLRGTRQAVYVVGQLPDGCSSVNAVDSETTIVARVSADTVRSFGRSLQRLYLIRVR